MTAVTHEVVPDFDGFYHAHFRETVSIVYGLTADLADAQDIAQEAFSRAWQRWDALAGYDSPVYWVRRVATNLAHSRWRRVKVAAAYLVRQRPDDQIAEMSPDSVDIVNALRQLPISQRKAVVLHYFVDMPVEDVAAELEVPVGTVKTWLHRGRAALSAELGDEVRRKVTAPPADGIRRTADRRKVIRRAAATVTAFVLALVGGLAIFISTNGRHPAPPATPSPSITRSPDPSPAAPALPVACVPERLPLPGGYEGDSIMVDGGDSSGRFLTATTMLKKDMTAFLWENGRLVDAFSTGGSPIGFRGMNVNGVGIGGADNAPWFYRTGNRHSFNGTAITVKGLNNHDVAVGVSDHRPAVWRDLLAAPELLPLPAGYQAGTADAINDDGVIVGIVTAVPPTAFRVEGTVVAWYPDGSMREFGAEYGRTVTGPAGLYGDFLTARFPETRLIWNLRTGATQNLGSQPVSAISRHGWLAITHWEADGNGTSTLSNASSSMTLAGDLKDGAGKPYVTVIAEDGKTLGGVVLRDFGDGGKGYVPARWNCA